MPIFICHIISTLSYTLKDGSKQCPKRSKNAYIYPSHSFNNVLHPQRWSKHCTKYFTHFQNSPNTVQIGKEIGKTKRSEKLYWKDKETDWWRERDGEIEFGEDKKKTEREVMEDKKKKEREIWEKKMKQRDWER